MAINKLVPHLRFPEFTSNLPEIKLEALVKFKSGGTPPMDDASNWNGEIPWISASAMLGKYYTRSEKMLTEKGLGSKSKLAEKGNLLLLVRGSMLFNKIPIGIAERDLAFNQDVKAISPNSNLNNEFLYQWFMSKEQLLLNKVVSTGIGAGKLDTEELKNLIVSLPVFEEQQKIASFLSAVDEKIQQLNRKKELLEKYKQGVMQQIFSRQIYFKKENGKKYSEWEIKKVKDLFTVTRGNVLSMNLVTEDRDEVNKYPVYSSQTRNNGLAGYYTTFLFKDCITWTTDGAGAGDVNFRKGEFYCTNVCGVLKSEEGYANEFIALLLNSVSRKYVSYVGNPKLMNNVMAEISICIPSDIEEQAKYSMLFTEIEGKISQINRSLKLMTKFKKSLLQQMFV